jgi:hypothetical protein
MKYENIGVIGNGTKNAPYQIIRVGPDSPIRIDAPVA